MKKLIIILSLFCSCVFGQTATNNIVNTATIMSTNSPLSAMGAFAAGSPNAVVTQFITSSNAGNPVLVLRNYAPSGNAALLLKNSAGTDAATIGTANNGTNVLIFSFMTAGSYIRLTTASGSSANEMYILPGITTNAGPFWANSVNSTNYQVNGVRGQTLSVTNMAALGVSNVEVFAEGILTNKFTIP